ncbi:uncharacterized protein LOC143458364 [Clavelina lepadiformis]|uniref:uncharacterized protein LOC143458364 n=1 Tax=Clavelina lepadiformis TaxID=159417 RepID=UPI0040430D32
MAGAAIAFCIFTSFILLGGISGQLLCSDGGQMRPMLLPDIPFQQRTCRDGQKCMRGKAVVEFQAPPPYNVQSEITAATCMDAAVCEPNRNCTDVVGEAIDEFGSRTGLRKEFLVVLSCDYVCCASNNCNNATIGEIRATQATSMTAP